jgi:uncharacterized protein YbjT (DUF2867 family)
MLVLGGTGTLGAPVVRSLVERGHTVRLLARHPEHARGMFGAIAEVVEGDSTERDRIRSALAGCDAVHISLPVESELTAVQHITDVAGSGILGRISYVSGTSVREENRWFDLIDVKLRAEWIR